MRVVGVYRLVAGSGYTGFGGRQKIQRGSGGQGTDFRGVAIEKSQALDAGFLQVVVNIFAEVGADLGLGDAQPWGPLAGDKIEAGGFETVVTRLLKGCGQVWSVASRRGQMGAVVSTEFIFTQFIFNQDGLSNRPEGEDEGLAGEANPFLG